MIQEKERRLIIISAPSGTGKSSIIKKLFTRKKFPFGFSISSTTRQQRPSEKEGVHYYFVSKEEFEIKKKNGEFLESATVHNHYYGTSFKEVERILNNGEYCILDIDVQGALNLSEKFPDSVTIFVLPPSFQELEKRLLERKDTAQEDIFVRLKNAKKEMEYISHFQYFLINDDINHAAHAIEKIIDHVHRKE